MQTIEGIKVNVVKIASGFHAMLDDDELACLAFGMLPAVKMRVLHDCLAQRGIRVAVAGYHAAHGRYPNPDEPDDENWLRSFPERFASAAESAIATEIYQQAEMVV